jgi:hypothetical protein
MRRFDPQGTNTYGRRLSCWAPLVTPSDPLGWAEQAASTPRGNDSTDEFDWERAWIDLGGEG